MNYQSKVKEFQILSGQPVSDIRKELTKEEFDFRDNLLQEEIRELKEAVVDNNRVEILDALCDIIYVALGTCNQMGWNNFNYEHYFSRKDYINIESLDLWSSKNDYCIRSVVQCCYTLASNLDFTLENFKIALERVHLSNLSKFCYDTKTAERTKEFYEKQGIKTYSKPVSKNIVVYREGDGKVLKSIDYFKVELSDLV